MTEQQKGGPSGLLANGKVPLAATEFITIQAYVESALALPKSRDDFAKLLGAGAPSDLGDLDPLITVYRSMYDASKKWKDHTFPATVTLASDIYQYGHNTVPTYYGAIESIAETLKKDPSDATAKATLKEIATLLRNEARLRAGRASAVHAEVREFSDRSHADLVELVGPNNDGGLRKAYDEKYGKRSDQVRQLVQDIETQRKVFAEMNAAYEHDKVVAATTPTYLVIPIPFVGLIAAAIVAGIFGKRATDALAAANAAQTKINELTDDMAAATKLMASLHLATGTISTIVTALAAALPAIDHIRSVWSAMADDLEAIESGVERQIEHVMPLILTFGAQGTIRAWEAAAQAADAYRTTAFINVVSLDQYRKEHPEVLADPATDAA